MKSCQIKSFRVAAFFLVFLVGIFVGRIVFSHHPVEHDHAEQTAQIWTCSMHPQIRQDHPGLCPLCAMELTPLAHNASSDAGDPNVIQLSEEAAALANIQTTLVAYRRPSKEIRLYGTIKASERRLNSLVAHVGGRIETLMLNYAGESVREGQHIASIYSPDLLNAQQELLEAKKLESSQPALLSAARNKLRLWKIDDRQIEEIEQSGKASPTISIPASATGTVVRKRVEQGDYVSPGGILFDIADLSAVWAVFDAYETDLPYLKNGMMVEYTLQSLPGRTFSGQISFIDPVIDKTTRTAKVRVETPNHRLELKPEMYANGIVRSSLGSDSEEIIIPRSSILWTGKRSIVYIKEGGEGLPTFSLREVELGVCLGDEYVVVDGLWEGEEIVTNGAFVIDASAQLNGKPSMMGR